jgi:hypothetical protein
MKITSSSIVLGLLVSIAAGAAISCAGPDETDGTVQPSPSTSVATTAPVATTAAPVASTAAPAASSAAPAGLPCDALPLLASKCGNCHTGPGGTAESNLKNPTIAGLLDVDAPPTMSCKGKKLIDSANPQASLLVVKLTNAPGCGSPMRPFTTITDAEVKCITDWSIAVANGAR